MRYSSTSITASSSSIAGYKPPIGPLTNMHDKKIPRFSHYTSEVVFFAEIYVDSKAI